MSALKKIKSAKSLHDVANILGFKPKSLAYVIHGMSDDAKYHQFEIPKKTEGTRVISAPCPELKNLQKRLSELLQDCLDEMDAEREIASTLSHAFRRNFSIVTNAESHRKKRYVFNLDLSDFFGSINFGRVRGFFIKNRNFELTEAAATVLAQIACFENSLPQGSPCSPVISNLIGHTLDIRLAKLAKNNRCYYTRYADDITFSTNERTFPSDVAVAAASQEHNWVVGNELESTIKRSGFSINPSKTRMQYKNSRQAVTGLVVNKIVNVRAEYKRKVRAMAHSLFMTGSFDRTSAVKGTIAQLGGMFGFIDSVNRYNQEKLEASLTKDAQRDRKNHLNGGEQTYRNFIFFKNFYFNDAPTIICEGKTDNVYLKFAIKSLASDFPDFVEKSSAGELTLKIRFFEYTDLTKRLLGLSGGYAPLKSLIGAYRVWCERFKAPGLAHPVIVVVDNDSGGKEIFSVVKQKIGSAVDGSANFYFIAKNLYVVAVPKIDMKDTAIEDCFQESTLPTKVAGKSFNRNNDHDTQTEYGKHYFSTHVIAANYQSIDFKGFKELLKRINLVLTDYKKKNENKPESSE
ncbi:retron Ec67 family RNA-directed DNA polymerase/endonuclease [Paraburkholderia fungorum]|uniref:retron Ec67 family RNA-directed DNA polymerase/endonuclease n=1 Tax=Paraburkholderia fungorum TaxID=134537 RepID=UPI00248DD62B|nr:retron Ec67 family RNA-directed DNA polymerase/endonuclease [Paraburkholderia fungorum]